MNIELDKMFDIQIVIIQNGLVSFFHEATVLSTVWAVKNETGDATVISVYDGEMPADGYVGLVKRWLVYNEDDVPHTFASFLRRGYGIALDKSVQMSTEDKGEKG